MVSIQPRKDRGFAFSGEAEIEFYTTSIDFNKNIRLFRSHDGGMFEDITNLTAPGRLTSAWFRQELSLTSSCWLIIRDQHEVSNAKAAELASFLSQHVASPQ